MVNKVKRIVITFRHDDHEQLTLYCCLKFAKVVEEGSSSEFSTPMEKSASTAAPTADKGAVGVTENGGSNDDNDVVIPPSVFHAMSRAEDIQMVRGMGFDVDVDDDNEPAVENISYQKRRRSERRRGGGYGEGNVGVGRRL